MSTVQKSREGEDPTQFPSDPSSLLHWAQPGTKFAVRIALCKCNTDPADRPHTAANRFISQSTSRTSTQTTVELCGWWGLQTQVLTERGDLCKFLFRMYMLHGFNHCAAISFCLGTVFPCEYQQTQGTVPRFAVLLNGYIWTKWAMLVSSFH